MCKIVLSLSSVKKHSSDITPLANTQTYSNMTGLSLFTGDMICLSEKHLYSFCSHVWENIEEQTVWTESMKTKTDILPFILFS